MIPSPHQSHARVIGREGSDLSRRTNKKDRLHGRSFCLSQLVYFLELFAAQGRFSSEAIKLLEVLASWPTNKSIALNCLNRRSCNEVMRLLRSSFCLSTLEMVSVITLLRCSRMPPVSV